MKKYRIAIEETLRKVVEIEAETPGLAVCRAEDEYNEEKHVLSADNFAGADIALSTDDSSANTVRRRPGTARRSTCCTGAMPGTTVLPWSS